MKLKLTLALLIAALFSTNMNAQNTKKTLVAYFSCTGTTKQVAKNLAEAIGADLYEITPAKPYTSADLDWQNKQSRSSVEMNDKSSRPAIAGKVENMKDYSVVYVGFPIWWYVAPTIINTFLESYDFSGKTIVPFFTSGGSGAGKTLDFLKPSCSKTTNWKPAKRFSANAAKTELKSWADGLGL